MISLPRIIKNFNLYMRPHKDKLYFAGLTEELILPKLIVKTEEFQLGGLDTPVQMDMGLEKLECEFVLCEYNEYVIKHFNFSENIEFTFIGAMLPGKGILPSVPMLPTLQITIEMAGIIRSLDFGSWKPSEKQSLRAKVEIRKYKYITKELVVNEKAKVNKDKYSFKNEKILVDINIEDFKRNINKRNQLEHLDKTFSVTGYIPDF